MQREIEALLAAYLVERNKEAEVVQQLLTALAVGASARQRMMQTLSAAVRADAAPAPTHPPADVAIDANRPPPLPFSADISTAIAHLRAARNATTH
jgi:hypothetical protein